MFGRKISAKIIMKPSRKGSPECRLEIPIDEDSFCESFLHCAQNSREPSKGNRFMGAKNSVTLIPFLVVGGTYMCLRDVFQC